MPSVFCGSARPRWKLARSACQSMVTLQTVSVRCTPRQKLPESQDQGVVQGTFPTSPPWHDQPSQSWLAGCRTKKERMFPFPPRRLLSWGHSSWWMLAGEWEAEVERDYSFDLDWTGLFNTREPACLLTLESDRKSYEICPRFFQRRREIS